TSGTVVFTINSPPPTLTSITPNSGTPGTNVNVTLTGTNFAFGATVNSSNPGVTASNISVASATQITATLTSEARATGAAKISVTVGGNTSGVVAFSINPLLPTLTSIGPNAGAPGTNVNVTLTGTNFAFGATVNSSNPGVTASNISVASATQITATL